MSSSEYPDSVLEYVHDQGWTGSPTELREGAYIISGEREREGGSENMLLMIVCKPEDEVTPEHTKFLLKAARKKGVNTAGLTANVPSTDEAKQAIEQYGISVIDSETVLQKTKPQNTTSQSESHTESQIPETAYEVYGSRAKMILFGIGGLLLGFGAVGILLAGVGGWNVIIASVLGVLLFFGGGVLLLYQAVKHDPVLQITDEGIIYNKPIVASDFYSWSNIEQVSRVEQETGKRQLISSTQVHLQIQVSELDDGSTLSGISNQLNKATLGDDTDAHYIPMSSFGVEFDEVAEAIERYSEVPVTAGT